MKSCWFLSLMQIALQDGKLFCMFKSLLLHWLAPPPPIAEIFMRFQRKLHNNSSIVHIVPVVATPKNHDKHASGSSPCDWHNVSDHHFHNEGGAVTSCHFSPWFHQLPLVGGCRWVHKNLLQFSGKQLFTKSASQVSVAFSKATRKLHHDVG